MAKARAVFPAPPPWHAELATAGVTGTNGKTTTTTYIAAALSQLSAPIPRVTTVGFFVGNERLPVTGNYAAFLQTLRTGWERGARHAAIELSSEALALGFFHAWPCHVGVFTNLSRDHLDRHGSAEHYLASKAQLFLHLPPGGAAILNGCDPVSSLLAEVIPKGVRVLYYGVPSRGPATLPLSLRATSVDISWSGTEVRLAPDSALGALPEVLTLRAIGEVFAENALAALTAAIAMGVPANEAIAAIARTPAPPGRFEVVREEPHVVIDYAHTPDALQRTLEAARRLTRGELTVVFGAGGERDQPKRPAMGRAAALADRVVLTSDNPRSEDPSQIVEEIRAGLTGHRGVQVIPDRREAIQHAVRTASELDVIVVAGKGHETEQQINQETQPFSDRDVVLMI